MKVDHQRNYQMVHRNTLRNVEQAKQGLFAIHLTSASLPAGPTSLARLDSCVTASLSLRAASAGTNSRSSKGLASATRRRSRSGGAESATDSPASPYGARSPGAIPPPPVFPALVAPRPDDTTVVDSTGFTTLETGGKTSGSHDLGSSDSFGAVAVGRGGEGEDVLPAPGRPGAFPSAFADGPTAGTPGCPAAHAGPRFWFGLAGGGGGTASVIPGLTVDMGPRGGGGGGGGTSADAEGAPAEGLPADMRAWRAAGDRFGRGMTVPLITTDMAWSNRWSRV